MSTFVFFSIVVDFISFLTVHSRCSLQRLVHNESNCRRVLVETDTDTNNTIFMAAKQRRRMNSQLHFNPKHPLLRILTEGQEPLVRVQQLV